MSAHCPVWYWWLNLRLQMLIRCSKCKMTQWSNVGSAALLWLYFWLVGLNRSIYCRGFLWFIFRKCKHGKLSVWLTLRIMSKIFSSLDMTTVFLPSVWRMAARLSSSLHHTADAHPGKSGSCLLEQLLAFLFWSKLEKKKTKLSNSVWYLSHQCIDSLSPPPS